MTLHGRVQLDRRLRAIGDTRDLMRVIQLETVAGAKKRVPRKTGHLARNIIRGRVSSQHAIVEARTPYAATVEFGSKPHVIEPKKARMLAWPESGGDRRLSGRARSKVKGRMIFAKKVHHPGTKPQPYLIPAAKDAVHKALDSIVRAWNDAA